MQKSYYAIIPAIVRYDKDLSPNAKLLYGEITALCNEKGYCWASNSYFANLYQKDISTIKRWIKQLADKGYITRKVKYKEGGGEIETRWLQICTEGSRKNEPTPQRKNEPDNNTVFNTTLNNTKNIYSNEFEQFWLIYPRKIDKKKAFKSFKAVIKKHSLDTILNGTKKYAQHVQKKQKDYIKYPATFLNNESFIDGFEEGVENVESNPYANLF